MAESGQSDRKPGCIYQHPHPDHECRNQDDMRESGQSDRTHYPDIGASPGSRRLSAGQSDRIPRTEAGRALIEGMRRGRAVGTLGRIVVDQDWTAVVLDIEDEAAAPPEPPLDAGMSETIRHPDRLPSVEALLREALVDMVRATVNPESAHNKGWREKVIRPARDRAIAALASLHEEPTEQTDG